MQVAGNLSLYTAIRGRYCRGFRPAGNFSLILLGVSDSENLSRRYAIRFDLCDIGNVVQAVKD